MSVYDNAAALALSALTEKGRALTFKRFSGDFDPITGSNGQTAFLATVGQAMSVPIGKNDTTKMDNRLVEALTQGRLRKLICAASGMVFEPEPSDVTQFDGSYWIARGVTPLSPAGLPILYYIIVERAGISAEQVAALDLVAYEVAVDELHASANSVLPQLLQ